MKRTLSLIVVLAFVATTPGCGIKRPPTVTPRDKAAVALDAFSKAIGGLQDGVVSACNVKAIAVVRCQEAGTIFIRIWQYDGHAIDLVLAWKPGQPIPANVLIEIQTARGLIADLALDKLLPDKVVAYYTTLADVLLLFGGVS